MNIKKWLARGAIAALAVALAAGGFVYWELRSLGFFRAPVYDTRAPDIPELRHPALLVFSKTNGFIHKEAIPAANALFERLAAQHGWSIYFSENGAINNTADLQRFDVVIWNNVTGDVLTPAQQADFKTWLEHGGRWLGIHGSGGDHFSWTWFVENVVAAEFVGHTMSPQFTQAEVVFENTDHPLLAGLPARLRWTDELYSFKNTPRDRVHVLATLDESSYLDKQTFNISTLTMGDHPVIWWRPVGEGIAVYSALGHTTQAYASPDYQRFLENALLWLMHERAMPGGNVKGCQSQCSDDIPSMPQIGTSWSHHR